MRRIVVVCVVCVLGTAGGAGASPVGPHLQFAAGKILRIDRTRIAIGHVSCRIGHGMFISGFVVGQGAVIACVRSELEKIAHTSLTVTGSAPAVSGSIQGAPGAPGNVSISSISDANSSTSSVVSSNSSSSSVSSSVSSSSSSSGGTTVTTSSSENGVPGTQATGVVSALSSSSITVGSLTCSIDPHVSALIGNAVAVGDTASISCNNGALAALAVGHTA